MESNYGLLINTNAKLYRKYFEEMVSLLGVMVKYQTPKKKLEYNLHGEYHSNQYSDPVIVGAIFEEHIKQETAKKLGWNSELTKSASLIHVPYNLDGLQVGCLFEVPSAYDNTQGRLFRVTKLFAEMIYPASITCEIVPEFIDNMSTSEVEDFTKTNFNVLKEVD